MNTSVLEAFGDEPITYQLIEKDYKLNRDQAHLLKDSIDLDKLLRL